MPLNPDNIDPAILLQNNSPVDDFCGLSATEMHHLLYDTFGERSILSVHKNVDDSTLDHIPFFRLTEEFLRIIQRERSVKLTPTGALPRKLLHELYGHRLITDPMVESGVSGLQREIDSAAITSMHFTTQLAGLIKKTHNTITLTERGKVRLAVDSRQILFRTALESYTTKFNWASNDAFTAAPVAQLGWGYTAYLLHKSGDSPQTMQFYAGKYSQAFPQFLKAFSRFEYGTPEDFFTSCYCVRTFDRFLGWFGFAEALPGQKTVAPIDVFAKVFRFG